MQATELLKSGHEAVRRLFQELAGAPTTAGPERRRIFDTIAGELEVHAQIEEELFYPALGSVSARVDELRAEHDRVRALIGDLDGRDPGSPEFAALVERLQAAVDDHLRKEEGPVFRDAARLGETTLERLGGEMEVRQETLKTSVIQRGWRAIKRAARKVA